MSVETENQDNKKLIAKAKRKCMETAGEIHDIVEDTLWSDYIRLPELSEKLVSQIKEYEEIKD